MEFRNNQKGSEVRILTRFCHGTSKNFHMTNTIIGHMRDLSNKRE